MATYVLVHGGAHGGWCYQPVAALLRQAGHEVYTPTLTGLGERSHLLSPEIDLELHIKDVTAVLEYEDLHDVYLVGHSYGGMVITGSADHSPDRVGNLVYLDAAVPSDGQSLADVSPGQMRAARDAGRVVDGVELVLFPGTEPIPHYGVTDPQQIAWMTPKLTPHPYACFAQPLRLEDEERVRAMPQTHITCTAWLEHRLADPNVAKARDAGRLWDIDTGHDLMISEPKQVADLLIRAAAE